MAVSEARSAASARSCPVSATTGEQVDVLIDVLVAQLPPGPAFYPDGELTDEPEEVLMAELIREAALEGRARRAAALAGRGHRRGQPARGPRAT